MFIVSFDVPHILLQEYLHNWLVLVLIVRRESMFMRKDHGSCELHSFDIRLICKANVFLILRNKLKNSKTLSNSELYKWESNEH